MFSLFIQVILLMGREHFFNKWVAWEKEFGNHWFTSIRVCVVTRKLNVSCVNSLDFIDIFIVDVFMEILWFGVGEYNTPKKLFISLFIQVVIKNPKTVISYICFAYERVTVLLSSRICFELKLFVHFRIYCLTSFGDIFTVFIIIFRKIQFVILLH